MSYPCNCTPSVISDPGPCVTGNCLKLPNLTIDPLTSVLPCGGSFSIDIGQYADFSYCDTLGGTIVWSVTSYDNTVFENVAITSEGVVTGSTTSGALEIIGDLETERIEVVVQAACSGTLLAVKRTIKIPIRDACLNKTCESGFTCYPCTGACVEGVPDLILT